ncbi:hypothetical protein, partial [Xylanibacter caecicola]|uniref:hypothetical protein n=1 Tax=Xylanibacter caecicola TaxID=2736294 RepID=UPI002597118C
GCFSIFYLRFPYANKHIVQLKSSTAAVFGSGCTRVQPYSGKTGFLSYFPYLHVPSNILLLLTYYMDYKQMTVLSSNIHPPGRAVPWCSRRYCT